MLQCLKLFQVHPLRIDTLLLQDVPRIIDSLLEELWRYVCKVLDDTQGLIEAFQLLIYAFFGRGGATVCLLEFSHFIP